MEEERILPNTAHSSGKESYLSDQVPHYIVLIRLSQPFCTTTELVRPGKLWEKPREPLHPILGPLHLIMQVVYYEETGRYVSTSTTLARTRRFLEWWATFFPFPSCSLSSGVPLACRMLWSCVDMRVFADIWLSLEIPTVNGQDFTSPFLYPSGFFSNQTSNNKMKVFDFTEL